MASDYGDKSSESKVKSSGSLTMISAGGKSGENSGPTGSSRSYPKSGRNMPVKMRSDFNPQKAPCTDYLVGGV